MALKYTNQTFATTLMWPFVVIPDLNPRSGKKNYHTCVKVTDAIIEKIQKLDGHKNRLVREFEGVEGKFMKFTKPQVLDSDGNEIHKLELVDTDGNPIEGFPGNGTKANVTLAIGKDENGIARYIGPTKIEVTELVLYEKKEKDTSEGGLTVSQESEDEDW